MQPGCDQAGRHDDRVRGGIGRNPGPDDLRPAEIEDAAGFRAPASGSDALAGALATEAAEEGGQRSA
jgi:hypothetical protein